MTKQQSAEILYNQGFELTEIASVLKTSYSTVTKWSATNKWRQKKQDKILREQTSQERIIKLIDYQLRVIDKITQLKEKEIENIDDINELKKSLIERGDIDALQKLFTTIKSKEITWDQVVKTARELLEHIAEVDLVLAKKITPIVDEWLNEKREQI